MIGYHKGNFVYIPIQKNGSSTFSSLLNQHGWGEIDLTTTELDLNTVRLWGHITHPMKRHTKGLAEFISINPDINFNDPVMAKILVNGIFDSHTSSISMLLQSIFYLPIYWIPLDATIVNFASRLPPFNMNGNDLTNDFFKENGIDIQVSDSDILNKSSDNNYELRYQIDELKKTFHSESEFVKLNGESIAAAFNQDMLLYFEVVNRFNNKYRKHERLNG